MDIFYLICCFIACIATTAILCYFFEFKPKPVQYKAIDGLRGYLAISVFFCHVFIFQTYLKTGKWTESANTISILIGETCVALFFMISAFLFFSKLIESKTKPIDWLHFYVSRILRLLPAYFLLICFVLVTALFSDLKIKDNSTVLILKILNFIFFELFDAQTINGADELIQIAGNTIWTLQYEWVFYFSLPLTGWIFFGKKTSSLLLITCLIVVIYMHLQKHFYLLIWYSFLVGAIVAWLIKWEWLCQTAKKKRSTILALFCLFILVYFFSTAFGRKPLFLLGLAFTCVAGGNSFFGLLTHPISRLIGELTYVIYLFHSLFLYIVFKCITFHSDWQFWIIVVFISLLLIVFSFFVHFYIELPILDKREITVLSLRKYISQLKENYFKTIS